MTRACIAVVLCLFAAFGVAWAGEVPAGAPAATFPPPETGSTWLNYWVDGGIAGGPQYALTVDQSGAATFRRYFPTALEAPLAFSPAEMVVLHHLVAPLPGLAGEPISRGGADVFNNTLHLTCGGREVKLTWQLTEQPDLGAFMDFVERISNQARLRGLLASEDPEQRFLATVELTSDLDRVHRPESLAPALWAVVAQPRGAMETYEGRSVFGNAVAVLGRLVPREEWAGRLLSISDQASPDRRLAMALALEPYVSPAFADVPWRALTSFFVGQYQAVAALPEAQRTPPQQQAVGRLAALLGRLDDPRARAALSGSPSPASGVPS